MPNQPKTPLRSFRCPDDLWDRAKAKAASNDETVTDALVRALEDYTASSPSVTS